MRFVVLLLAFAFAAAGQTAPIQFQVHYLGKDTIKAKYGHALPKSIYAGSVTGSNSGVSNVVFGQGLVLQTLREHGYHALSQQDARAIVLRAQQSGFVGVWNRWSPTGVKILDDLNDLQIFKVLRLPPGAAAALDTADRVARATEVDVNKVLADIYQTYDNDGIQNLMQLPPGGSLVGTLLFEAEGPKPTTTNAKTFTVEIPVQGPVQPVQSVQSARP